MSRPSTAVDQWPVPGRPGWFVRLHPPGKGKASWRVTFPDGRGGVTENTRRTRESAQEHALTRVHELSTVVGGPSRGQEPIRALLNFYMTEYAAYRLWKPGYRQERAKPVRFLPAWFLDLPTDQWRTRHCDEVLAAVAKAGHPLGSGEYWRVGTLLSGLVTAGDRGDFLMITSNRPSPMRNVRYSRRLAGAAPGDNLRASAEGRDTYSHVRPVPAEAIPSHRDADDYAAAAGELSGFRWMVHGKLLSCSGIREAESLRLTVDDVMRDPDKPFVHVWRQLVEIRKDLSPTGMSLLTEESPKNGRARYAWYPADLLPLLEELVAEVAALPGSVPVGERVLFYGKGGGLVRPNNWRRRVFDPAATSLGWEQVRKGNPDPRTGVPKLYWTWPPHALRHHAATWMLKDLGLRPVVVAEYLGHKYSAFTERMYLDRTGTDFSTTNAAFRAWRQT